MTMGKEEGKKMAENKPMIESSVVKLSQDFTDLKTFADVEVAFEHPRFKLTDEGQKTENVDAAIREAQKLFSSKADLLAALVNAATSAAYSKAKSEALAKGDYLTPDLRSAISKFTRSTIPAFAELSAKDAYNRWLEGYKAKKAGAIKVLQIVRADSSQFGDL